MKSDARGFVQLTDAEDGRPIWIKPAWIASVASRAPYGQAVIQAPGYGGAIRLLETAEEVRAAIQSVEREGRE